jgi:hypothetical protein
MSDLTLYLWWGLREPTPANDTSRLSRFVSGLPDFDPIYLSWLRSPKTKKQVLPVPLSPTDAHQLLSDNIGRYDDGRLWPEIGSRFSAGHAGPAPYDFRKSSYADTSCTIGAFGRSSSPTPNHVFMRLSELRPSTGRSWRASELRPLMKFAREIWNPTEMCAMFSFYKGIPEIPDPKWAAGVRTLKPWIGWITYLPPDLASRASYPADTEIETLDDGAALVTLCEEPFGKTDAAGLARLHALEAALRPIQS